MLGPLVCRHVGQLRGSKCVGKCITLTSGGGIKGLAGIRNVIGVRDSFILDRVGRAAILGVSQ